MIAPQLAAVRPRVYAAGSGEALPLDDEVRRLLDRGTRGVVALLGPAGSGKTAALRHLAAALPAGAPVTFLDGPDYPGWAPDASRLVVYAPASAPKVSPYVTDRSCSSAPCATWITSKAFSSAAPGAYGNLGYNNLKGPGLFSLDLALSRSFPIDDKRSLQVRAEAFNLPNWVNLNPPVSTLTSGAFGQIQSSGDPRILQLAMKFVF